MELDQYKNLVTKEQADADKSLSTLKHHKIKTYELKHKIANTTNKNKKKKYKQELKAQNELIKTVESTLLTEIEELAKATYEYEKFKAQQ